MAAGALIGILAEILIGAVVCGVIWRVADADNRSPLLWSAITFAICVGSVAIPFPYARQLFAGGVALTAMFVTNLVRLPAL
jgi:hypothetical protein